MPNTNTEEDLDGQELDDEETEETEESEETEETEETEKPKDKTDKRVSDLQSALDKEKARANKLEKALNRGQGDEQGGKDPEREALMAELREASLDAVYGEYDELKRYGISRDLIEGSTRAEMRESATSLVALVNSVATKARNQALRDAGVSAEPVGNRREQPKNWATMSEEEFEKELARHKSGGPPIWG